VPRADAKVMLAELKAGLSAAESDGRSLREYVGNDIRGFALDWARARGIARIRIAPIRTAITGVLGCVPGAIFGPFAAWAMSSEGFAKTVGMPRSIAEPVTWEIWEPPIWVVIGLYALGALFAYLGAIAALSAYLSWREDPAKSRTLRYFLLGMPFGITAAILITIAFASTCDFSTDLSITTAYYAVALTVFAVCIAALRLAAVRRERAALVFIGELTEAT
jgi:hypothetical protein